jgi:hypothetical protein
MPNDAMLALLLDPFLTFDEVVKQVRAMPTAAGGSGATPATPAAQPGTASAISTSTRRRPAVRRCRRSSSLRWR